MIVAIDGPAGSGKSTISRKLAQRHGLIYLDTGAMYRSIAWLALERGIALDDEAELTKLAHEEQVTFLPAQDQDVETRISIAGCDVTLKIRTPEVDEAVSPVSAIPGVREALLETQRSAARCTGVIAEGRDIGTVVFPHADVKIFLTASPEARAKRRARQNIDRLGSADVSDEQTILDAINARDKADSSRATAPLKPADDAIHIDTSALSIEEVTNKISNLIASASPKESI